jgi:hypothetical protein
MAQLRKGESSIVLGMVTRDAIMALLFGAVTGMCRALFFTAYKLD